MKPKDLKAPHKFCERKPALVDGVLFVPVHYQDHGSFSMPTWQEIFHNNHPVHLEYCSGNGDWIVEKAKEHPHINWIAVEKRFDRVRKIWSKRENQHVANLLIVAGSAEPFTEHYVPAGSIAEAYVNFPDPWPKRAHAKHRLMAPLFLDGVVRVLQPGGKLTLATDDRLYCYHSVELLSAMPVFTPLFPAPHYVHEWEGGYGGSHFDSLWRAEGKVIHYVSFSKEGLCGNH